LSAAPDEPAIPAGPLATRLVTLEAIALLLAARLLIVAVPFGRWRRLLGHPTSPGAAGDRAAPGPVRRDRYLARAVDRAADRLPLQLKCLPRAMALHWMLARRGQVSRFVIGALPGGARRGVDDLHAWVQVGDETLIGQLYSRHAPVLTLIFTVIR